MQNKQKSLFQKVMFKMFSCPLFILLILTIGNYLIFADLYSYIGYQLLVLVALMVAWIRTADGNYKFKMMITKYE